VAEGNYKVVYPDVLIVTTMLKVGRTQTQKNRLYHTMQKMESVEVETGHGPNP
jgi:hypothetical protein